MRKKTFQLDLCQLFIYNVVERLKIIGNSHYIQCNYISQKTISSSNSHISVLVVSSFVSVYWSVRLTKHVALHPHVDVREMNELLHSNISSFFCRHCLIFWAFPAFSFGFQVSAKPLTHILHCSLFNFLPLELPSLISKHWDYVSNPWLAL